MHYPYIKFLSDIQLVKKWLAQTAEEQYPNSRYAVIAAWPSSVTNRAQLPDVPEEVFKPFNLANLPSVPGTRLQDPQTRSFFDESLNGRNDGLFGTLTPIATDINTGNGQ